MQYFTITQIYILIVYLYKSKCWTICASKNIYLCTYIGIKALCAFCIYILVALWYGVSPSREREEIRLKNMVQLKMHNKLFLFIRSLCMGSCMYSHKTCEMNILQIGVKICLFIILIVLKFTLQYKIMQKYNRINKYVLG